MGEIVGSVQRVSDVIGEITVASGEQSDGIGQVNTAVTQLDQMTQQNAALVEESTAAAESLRTQAQRLAQALAGFRARRRPDARSARLLGGAAQRLDDRPAQHLAQAPPAGGQREQRAGQRRRPAAPSGDGFQLNSKA